MVAEHSAEFEWRGDGEEAEIILYAPDEDIASVYFERALPASRLPGVESPIYAVASEQGSGWVAASSTHAATELISAPARGVLLAADIAAGNLSLPPEELPRLILRNFSEMRLPSLNEAGVRRLCESGARSAAEDGLIEEEDLETFGGRDGESDALGRRAMSAGTRDWDALEEARAYSVEEIMDSEGAETLGLEAGMLVFVLLVGAGNLGRLAIEAHRERILDRVWHGEFDTDPDLPAAPLDTEEARDLLAASEAAANFAAGRSSLLLYALRHALAEPVGNLRTLASWTMGGFGEHGSATVHRRGLSEVRSGEIVVPGGSVAAGTGAMLNSAPPFGVADYEGRWPWEEAGLCERFAGLRWLEQKR